eukprot:m.145055 g.145055  ORF g.145055 m.145055 type:complete len:314 (-) comp16057_c0_seq6:68-1009(-)
MHILKRIFFLVFFCRFCASHMHVPMLKGSMNDLTCTGKIIRHKSRSSKLLGSCMKPQAFHIPGLQQEVFENCQCTGGVPIRVLPEIIDTDVTFNPSQYTLEDAYAFLPVASKAFTFVSVGKWELRKDFELLVDVFLNEFREELDKVHLVLRTSPPRFWQEQVQQKHNLQQPLPITILEQLSTRELALLYKAADAFVIASHGEGFGRPPAEAISMAVPTIAIDWSGLSAFISNDTAYPLHVSTLVNVPGGDSEQWAHITAPQLASVMRHVYTYPEEAKARGMAGRQYMVDNFSPTAVRRQLVSLIQRSVARNTK